MVAAILVFRAVTYLLPIPLGLISYIIWRLNKSWRLTEDQRAQLAGDAYEYGPTPTTDSGSASVLR